MTCILSIYWSYISFCVNPKFIVLLCYFSWLQCDFLGTNQEIGCKEHLRYDLFSVEWDVQVFVCTKWSLKWHVIMFSDYL